MTGRTDTRQLGKGVRVALVGLAVAAAATLAADGSAAAEAKSATAEIVGVDGKVVGKATLKESPHGILLVVGFEGLPPGAHAFHIHEVGKCDPIGGFQSAGGHFNPEGKKHGLLAPGGAHAGDLPNVHTPGNMSFVVEVFVPGLSLAEGPGTLFDADGSSLVLHERPDDYMSDPAGDAGGRIACGVIRK